MSVTESSELMMHKLVLLFLFNNVFGYGGYHVPNLSPQKQRSWLRNIIDNFHGKHPEYIYVVFLSSMVHFSCRYFLKQSC